MTEHTQIVSSTARRTRIRVSRKRRNKKEMARLAESFRASPGIEKVDFNLGTGTIVLYHKDYEIERIKEQLEDLGIILAAAAMDGQVSAESLTRAIEDLDKYVCSATGGYLSLKLLAPVGFGTLAALQLARRGLEIGGAPWYLLAYFAYESYVKLNRSEPICTPGRARQTMSE